MSHSFEELKSKPVAALREIAKGLPDHEALHGYTTMHKGDLVQALCTALGIDTHAHHAVVGVDKSTIKAHIRTLKKERDALLGKNDPVTLKRVRRRIHRLKEELRRATV